MGRLDHKVAIVTGASSGIGRAIAIGFAREGAQVVCSDIRKDARPEGYETDRQQDTDEVIRANSGDALFVRADVTRSQDMADLVKNAVDRYGRLDIMVNNAGVFTRLAPIHEKTEEEYDFTTNVNAKGVWNGCQQAIRQFLRQGDGGKIINIVSIAGIIGLANEPAYCASKGAAANLTRQLAIDYGPHRINVNAICPNFLTTAMCRPYYTDASIRTMVEEATPLRRWGTPEEIVGPAVFLASKDADYVTGSMLIVDGGYTAR
jgi:NAD(P)-dependent dehydrogenase (short-subunit alcohol dehydrogenase family)